MNNSSKENIRKTIQGRFNDDMMTDAKKKCKCGHTQLVYKNNQRDYGTCTWCGRRLYVDDKKQLEYNKKRDREEFISKFKNYLSGEGRGIIEI